MSKQVKKQKDGDAPKASHTSGSAAVDFEDHGPLSAARFSLGEPSDGELRTVLESLALNSDMDTSDGEGLAPVSEGISSVEAVGSLDVGESRKGNANIVDKPVVAPHVRMCGAAKKRYKKLLAEGKKPGSETKLLAVRSRKETGAPIVVPPPKRNRSDEDSPPAQKKPRGEKSVPAVSGSAVQSGVTFRQAAESVIIGILPFGFPKVVLTGEQLKAVQEGVLDKVLEQEARELKPKFLGSQLRPGWLIVTCADRATVQWLKEAIGTIKPWEGAQLILAEAGNLPRANIVFGTFPDSAEMPTKKLLGFVRSQNEGMEAIDWRVIRREARGSAAFCTFSMDHSSVEKLKQVGFRVHFRFGFVQLHPKGSQGGAKPASVSGPQVVKPVEDTVAAPVAKITGRAALSKRQSRRRRGKELKASRVERGTALQKVPSRNLLAKPGGSQVSGGTSGTRAIGRPSAGSASPVCDGGTIREAEPGLLKQTM